MYELQQGIENPRLGDLQWSVHGVYDSKQEAIDAVPPKGCWRVVQCTPVWLNDAAEEWM